VIDLEPAVAIGLSGYARAALVCVALVVGIGAAGCGSSSSSGSAPRSTTGSTQTSTRRVAARPPHAVRLRFALSLGRLPQPRSGVAVAMFGSSAFVIGGLSDAGESTSTVFRIDAGGAAHSLAALPGPVHDAAATTVGGRLLLFGGGQFEGSDRIVLVAPGPPRQIGTLPQALSDLTAMTIGAVAYVAGGWNGTDTNRDIYAVQPSGTVRTAGRLPVGVRYPAAAVLDGRVIVAGGETASGDPTVAAWSLDPATGGVTRLPDLPAATDHASGAVLGGRFYLLGGLRRGVFTRAVLSWAPGERSWREAGRLPVALADAGAAPFNGGIVVAGGRNSAGRVDTVTLLAAG